MTNTNDILKDMEDNEALQWLFAHKDLIRERAIEELMTMNNDLTIMELAAMIIPEDNDEKELHDMIRDCTENEFLDWMINLVTRPGDNQDIVNAVGIASLVRRTGNII